MKPAFSEKNTIQIPDHLPGVSGNGILNSVPAGNHSSGQGLRKKGKSFSKHTAEEMYKKIAAANKKSSCKNSSVPVEKRRQDTGG